jgi:hypothetical protein
VLISFNLRNYLCLFVKLSSRPSQVSNIRASKIIRKQLRKYQVKGWQ